MKGNIRYIKSEERVILNFWQTLGHYSFMLIPFLLPAFELFNKLIGKASLNIFSNTIVLFVIASAIIGFFKRRELYYYELHVSRTDNEFENAVLATANKLNWRINTLDTNQADATGHNPMKSRDFQSIKIKQIKNKVMINSMTEPDFLTLPDFFGINKTNRNTFFHYYYKSRVINDLNEKVIQHLKEEDDRIENEAEWNLKNTLKRIIVYFISLGFLGIGFAIWNNNELNIGVALLGMIGLSYIVFDIYILCVKMKRK